MLRLLESLAGCFRQSAAGSGNAGRDFLIEYEKFLRLAGTADGDERELAEATLAQFAAESGGKLTIERDRVTRRAHRLRLSLDGGEAWLFARLGQVSPSDARATTERFLGEAARIEVHGEWQAKWENWLLSLAQQSTAGGSVHPFRHDDAEGNRLLLKALRGVLEWKDPTTIRYASAALLGDSKLLQSMEPRLATGLEAITGDPTLEARGILRKPRQVALHGPLLLTLPNGTLDLSLLPAPLWLADGNILAATQLQTTATRCLTVENEDVFFELSKHRLNILLVQTSYPGAAVRALLSALPDTLPLFHFGDTDPAGFDILRDLREKSGRSITPLLMDYRPSIDGLPLTDAESALCHRLLAHPLMTDVAPPIRAILAAGNKGIFEQESLPLRQALHFLSLS